MKRAKRLVIFFCALASVVGVAGGGWYLGTTATSAKDSSHENTDPVVSSPSPSTVSEGTSNPLLLGNATPVTGDASPSPTASVPATVRETAAAPVKILMYHYIRDGVDKAKDPTGYGLSVTPAEFEQELMMLHSAGYDSVTMSEVAQGKTDAHSVAITFDDGYADLAVNALPLLKKYNFTATSYVITSKIGTGDYMSWAQIKDLQKAGIEIGSHTVSHRELSTLSEAEQRTEIESSRTILSKELGTPVMSFCYPSGRYNDTTVRLVQEAGYASATTTKSGSVEAGDSMFTLKRVRISPDTTATTFKKLFPAS